MVKKIPKFQKITTKAEGWLKKETADYWLLEEINKDFYAIDYSARILKEGETSVTVTGCEIKVQLKASQKPQIENNCIIKDGIKGEDIQQWIEEEDHIVVLIYYIVGRDNGYWIYTDQISNCSTYPGKSGQKSFRIKIPLENEFNDSSIRRISDFALGEHEKKMKSKKTVSKSEIELEKVRDFFEDNEERFKEYIGDISTGFEKNIMISELSIVEGYRYRKHKNKDFTFYCIQYPFLLSDFDKVTYIIAGEGRFLTFSYMKFLCDTLLKDKRIKRIKLKKFDLDNLFIAIKELPFTPTVMFIPNKYYVDFHSLATPKYHHDFTKNVEEISDGEVSLKTYWSNKFWPLKELIVINQNATKCIAKIARQTKPIKGFDNDIQVGYPNSHLDIRLRMDNKYAWLLYRFVVCLEVIDSAQVAIFEFFE